MELLRKKLKMTKECKCTLSKEPLNDDHNQQKTFLKFHLTLKGHICHTCASDNPQDPFMKYNSRLVRCIRCPTAYHSGDYCITAGGQCPIRKIFRRWR